MLEVSMLNVLFLQKITLFLLLFLVAPNVWSNRCAGRGCDVPQFKEMMPQKSSVVRSGSEFSFTASANTNPNSIRVIVKGHAVGLTITNKGQIKVSGILPEELTEGYVRINITASSSPSSCIGNDGWLIKIGD